MTDGEPDAPARPAVAESGEGTALDGAALLERCHDILRDVFGFASFRAGQIQAIEAIASGRDGLFIMPTGSGKSLCYQIPALVRPGVTLVVSPLIALMKDQVDGLALRGVPVTFINSSLEHDEQWARLEGLAEGRWKLVYVAPERFRNRAFQKALSRVHVSLLAVDEAHCISQWGHDFRPDYRRLREVREGLGGVQVAALTATATPDVQDDIARELGMDDAVRIVTGFDRPNLTYRVERLSSAGSKQEVLAEFLRGAARAAGGVTPSGIIYVGTRKHASAVAEVVRNLRLPTGDEVHGPACRAYHAGLEDDERREVQEDFMEGRTPIVCATNAFGMGVDKADIRFVVHYDLPGSVEAYYQEVGRAGRDGQPSECLLLFSERDRHLQEFFIEGSNPSRRTIEGTWRFLLSLGENPIFRTLAELERTIDDTGLLDTTNGMAFRSAVSVLDHAGALARLDHYESLADVACLRPDAWTTNPYRAQATVRGRVWDALREAFEHTERESVAISLERWSAELELTLDSLRRGMAHLQEDGWIRFTPPFRGRAIRLPESPGPLEVDFAALERKRQREKQRLAKMLGFARAVDCRRNLILDYFGEASPGGTCGECDNCRSGARAPAARRPLSDDEFTVVRKALSGVARVRGRCGRSRVVKMLRGSQSKAVRELGLDKLSTFGILSDLSGGAVRDIIDRLEEEGCVFERGTGRLAVVCLTEHGVRVMKGEERVEFPLPASAVHRAVAASSRAKPSPSSLPEAFDLSTDDEHLFQHLRSLRREFAREHAIPAYRVFTDRTLAAMSRIRPRSEADMLAVPGVGARTFELFGEAFVLEIRKYEAGESS